MILRNYMGRPISVNRQQVRSSYLLEAMGDMEDVPVIEETYREVLEDDMDVKNARYVLDMIESGKMSVSTIRFTGTPSPFAHSPDSRISSSWRTGPRCSASSTGRSCTGRWAM